MKFKILTNFQIWKKSDLALISELFTSRISSQELHWKAANLIYWNGSDF